LVSAAARGADQRPKPSTDEDHLAGRAACDIFAAMMQAMGPAQTGDREAK